MTRIVLQKIILPSNEPEESYYDIFYRGPKGYLSDHGTLCMPAFEQFDFATYLNGIPVNKWKRYTNFTNLTLTIRVKGNFKAVLVGYNENPFMPERHVLARMEGQSEEIKSYSCMTKDLDYEFCGFEISGMENLIFVGGEYSSEYAENDVRPVDLAIATTTCRKEQYIIQNVNKIRKQLIDSGEESICDHLYINVVDNGKTLSENDIYGRHVRLIPNNNAGGSGGYARGMMESIHMQPKPTNVLLMDDDVLVIPESIRRTYTLLSLLKESFQNAIISGAMLRMDELNRLHEDVGSLTQLLEFKSVKWRANVSSLKEVMDSNREFPTVPNMYAAWWYCCIPTQIIEQNGYSYPLFIRYDDVEYGIRCAQNFITMSGICIWHMSFENKFKESMDYYQRFRNTFIVCSADSKIHTTDPINRYMPEVQRNLLMYNYGGVEALLRALEDYMKGPEFLKIDHGAEILKELNQYNQVLKPLEDMVEMPKGDSYLTTLGGDYPLSFLQRVWYYVTYNGQRFYTPESKWKKDYAYVLYDWAHQPGRCAFHKNLIAVNPIERTANRRVQDKEKFKSLYKRYKRDLRLYKKNKEKLRKEYQESFKYMTSETFWRKYLKLDENN